jgi:hypothetical protein
MLVKDERIYSVVDKFHDENPNIIMRKNTQFFIKNFNDLKTILEYRNNIFIRYTKLCYSVNPRYFVNGDIAGEYKNLKQQHMIFLDIERCDHEKLSDDDRKLIENIYTKNVTDYLKRFGLNSYTLIRSGGGIHILYLIRPMEIIDGRREAYREFISELQEKTNSETFHCDRIIDSTRVIALPGSINHKTGFIVEWVKLGEENDFFIKAKRIRKLKPKPMVENKDNAEMDVRESLAWKLFMTPGLPAGSRNNLLIFYLKLLIRELDEDYRPYERELNSMYRGEQWRMNTKSGISGKTRQFGLLVNFCRENEEFCRTNKINYMEYKY